LRLPLFLPAIYPCIGLKGLLMLNWITTHFLAWVKTWNLTTFLAVWGAVLSSHTAVWSFRKDLRDKPKIKLSATLRCIGLRQGDGAPYMANPDLNIEGMGDGLYVVVSVTNIGRRKMRWKGWGGKYRNPVNNRDGFTVSPRFLPKTLDEQEHLDEWTDLDQQFVDANVKRLFIWDVAGKHWNVSRKDMNKLRDDIKRFAEPRPVRNTL
jgi:hypothetical protein